MHKDSDIVLTYNRKALCCELKASMEALGGSLKIVYFKNQTPHFQFATFDENKYPEKVFVRDIAIEADILEKINEAWEAPWNIEDRDSADEKLMLEKPLEDRYREDLQRCREFNILIPTELVTDYYAKKNIHYINVGTHGLYIFGDNDPFKLNEKLTKGKLALMPIFSQNVTIAGRARIQNKNLTASKRREKINKKIGGQGYQFTFDIKFMMSSMSPYNIGFCTKNNVTIIPSETTISFFMEH